MTTVRDLLDKYNAMQVQHGTDAPAAMLLWCRKQKSEYVLKTMIRDLERIIAEGVVRVFVAQQSGEEWRAADAQKYAVNEVERVLLKTTAK